MPNISAPEIILLLLVALLLFGAKRLPEIGRSLGTGMREFKDSIAGKERDAEPDEPAAEPEGIEPGTKPAATKDGKTDAVEEQVSGERRS